MLILYYNIPANLSNRGVYDIVYFTVVRLIFAELNTSGELSVFQRGDWKGKLHLSFFSDGSFWTL